MSTGTEDDDDPDLGPGDGIVYDDDADDDVLADDDADDDVPADDDADDDVVADDDADDDVVADDDADDDVVADDDAPDAGDDDVGADDDVTTPGTFMCMPESAEGDCEQCVQRADRCCDERAACANDPEGQCEAEWAAIKGCMAEKDLANNPDSDPVLVLQECMAEASGTGSDLDVSDELFALAACIGTSYMEPEAPAAAGDAGAGDAGAAAPADDLIEGDGLCTFACYGVDTLEPVDLDEGETDVR